MGIVRFFLYTFLHLPFAFDYLFDHAVSVDTHRLRSELFFAYNDIPYNYCTEERCPKWY